MKDFGKMKCFFGIELTQNEQWIFICQKNVEVLEQFGWEKSPSGKSYRTMLQTFKGRWGGSRCISVLVNGQKFDIPPHCNQIRLDVCCMLGQQIYDGTYRNASDCCEEDFQIFERYN